MEQSLGCSESLRSEYSLLSAQICKRFLDGTQSSVVHWLNDLSEVSHGEWALDLDWRLEARNSVSAWEGFWVRRERLLLRKAAPFCTWAGMVRAQWGVCSGWTEIWESWRDRENIPKAPPSSQPGPLGRVAGSWGAYAIRERTLTLESSRFRPSAAGCPWQSHVTRQLSLHMKQHLCCFSEGSMTWDTGNTPWMLVPSSAGQKIPFPPKDCHPAPGNSSIKSP